MKKLLPIYLVFVTFFSAVSFQDIIADAPVDLENAVVRMEVIQANRLIQHAKIISDRKHQGREAGLQGSRQTSAYIVKHFQKFGLSPGGPAGRFYQTFKIETGYRISSSLRYSIFGSAGKDFMRRNDYALLHLVDNTASIKAGLIFAGFGISQSDFGFDEYAQIDAQNKAVIVFTGVPWSNRRNNWAQQLAQQNEQISSLSYKAKNAAQNGANCLLVVDNPISWKERVNAEKEFRIPDFNSRIDSPIPIIHISQMMVETITGLTEEELIALAEDIATDQEPESMELRGRSISFQAEVNGEAWVGRNIIGVLPGNDKELRNQAIVIGAHYDHLGQRDSEIYFGANDNASGVSTMLGVAEAFSQGPRPKRTIIFVAFDAEEIGKRGSKFFIQHSIIPQERIAFMINFDMVGKNAAEEINAVATRSSNELHTIHQEMNNYVGLSLVHPRSYRLGRSDHTAFYRANIPVMYLFGGKDKEYNTPRDTWEKLIPSKLEKVSRLAYLTAFYVSNIKQRIEFNGFQEPVDDWEFYEGQ